ncbi:chlorohydrolase [Streptococcus pneumoniae]|nr:chlorohydrolase [Streptococcus pneumoniae]
MYCPPKVRQKESNFWGAVHKNLDSMRFIVGRLILFENLFKPRQFHLAVDMVTDFVSSIHNLKTVF